MKEKNKIVWIDCRNIARNKDKVALVNNLSFENILIDINDVKMRGLPRKSHLIVEVGASGETGAGAAMSTFSFCKR